MPTLVVTAGNAAGTQIALTQEFAIGRSAEGEGKLGDDPQLSRQHARVGVDPAGQAFIEDLGSTNGTFVNGQRISGRQALSPGDQIRVGHTDMTLQGNGAPAAAAPAAGGFAPPPQAAALPPTEQFSPGGAPPPTAPPPQAPAYGGQPAPGPPQGPAYGGQQAPAQPQAPGYGGPQAPGAPGYGAPGQAPGVAPPGTGSNGFKAFGVVVGVIWLVLAAIVGIATGTIVTAEEFEVRDGKIYQTTGTDKALVGIFGIPATLFALAVLPSAIYFAVTNKRRNLWWIFALVSLALGAIGFGSASAT